MRAQCTSSLAPDWIRISGQNCTGEAASFDGISLSPCGDVCVQGEISMTMQICIIGESAAKFCGPY